MVASNSTVNQVIAIFLEEIDKPTLRRVIAKLKEVPGNKSFRDTIELMQKKLNE